MIRSGLARTTNSGLSLGNGPSAAGTMFLHAQPRQRFADEGRFAGRIRPAVDFEIHPRVLRTAAGSDCAAADTPASMTRQTRLRALGHVQQLAQLAQHALHVGMVLGLQRHHLDAQRLQPLAGARGGGQQHHVGLERDDGFDVRVQPAAHLRQAAHAGRAVGIAVHADQALALPQRAHALGQRGQQADDALRRLRASVTRDAAVVGDLQRVGRRQRQRSQQPADQQRQQCASWLAFQGQRQTGRHQGDALAGLRHVLVEPAQRIDKGAHLAPQRNHAQADLVADQHHRAGRRRQLLPKA